MKRIIGLSITATAAWFFAALLHATPPTPGLQVDITSPIDRSRLPWGSQGRYAVAVSYAGKSTRYGELPSNDIVLRASFAPSADAPSARRSPQLPEGLVQISQSNCMGCHDFTASSAGPSFAAIAKRYAGHPAASAMLAGHIRNGSSDAWGGGAMPPHPDINAAQAGAIARWILANGNDPAVQYAIGKDGSFRMNAVGTPGPRAGMVLSAFYTGPLKPGDTRNATAGRSTLVVYGAGF